MAVNVHTGAHIMRETQTHLSLSWSTSRGRETYGYNIARLVDDATGKRYRCSGGGYDMQGTVFGAWLQDTQQDRLQAIAYRSHNAWDGDQRQNEYAEPSKALYGMTRYFGAAGDSIKLDGACGIESMRSIAKAAGLRVQFVYGSRNGLKAIIVTETVDTETEI